MISKQTAPLQIPNLQVSKEIWRRLLLETLIHKALDIKSHLGGKLYEMTPSWAYSITC